MLFYLCFLANSEGQLQYFKKTASQQPGTSILHSEQILPFQPNLIFTHLCCSFPSLCNLCNQGPKATVSISPFSLLPTNHDSKKGASKETRLTGGRGKVRRKKDH